MDFLDHDYPFEYCIGFFCHEVGDEIEFALDCIKIAAFEFKEDDPVGYYLIKGGLLSYFYVE